MLEEEKRTDNTVWFNDGICKYKVNKEEKDAIIWVNFEGFDIVMPMMLWDFNYDVEEAHIDMKIDKSWNGYSGFRISRENVMQFIGVIEFFLTEKNPHNMILSKKFSDNWF